jgi:transcriptional/translational regulatory protein YebC/TACO1
LRGAGYVVDDAELQWVAKNESALEVEKALTNMRLMGELEELDDVQSVASNLQITDEIIAAFETA